MLRFENLEGIVLVDSIAISNGAVDTLGPFVFDSGAGYLALDAYLAERLGLSDKVDSDPVGLATRPLQRLRIGDIERDQVSPILTIDAGIVRDVTDRPVLGLLGQRLFADRVVWIDYQARLLALIPGGAPSGDDAPAERSSMAGEPSEVAGESNPGQARAASQSLLTGVISAAAIGLSFELAGDGKVLVRAQVSDPDPKHLSSVLTLIVDTGASKTVLFEHALAGVVRSARRWPSVRGLQAPTLVGSSDTRIARVQRMVVSGTARRSSNPPIAAVNDLDVAVLDSELQRALSDVTQSTIHGLLGYSFLKHFRVAIDYPHRMLWLDPVPDYVEDRPFEYSQVGLQLERRGRQIEIVAIAEGSPAAKGDVRIGDSVDAIDGHPMGGGDLLEASRALEGPPGSSITLTLSRDGRPHGVRIVRKRLL